MGGKEDMRYLAVFLALLFVPPVLAGDLAGTARVIEGDKIEIDGKPVRLHGIDAPEMEQSCEKGGKHYRCGQKAARALREKIGGGTVRCTAAGICYLGKLDLNGWMVKWGHAVADRKTSEAYLGKEAKARRARRGVWHGRFAYPWDWRRGKR
jgi:endonuclease YncB( thermonuclease family)